MDGTRIWLTQLSIRMSKNFTWHVTACHGALPLTDNVTCKTKQFWE